MVRVAFSEELIQDGTVSNPIEIAPGHSVVIRVTGHTAERALTLDEVRERVVAEIRGDGMHEAAEAEADEMVAQLARPESRRVGKPVVRRCRDRWSPLHSNIKTRKVIDL